MISLISKTLARILAGLTSPSNLVASIVIRNLEDELKERLRMRAARCGRSMEEEARIILRSALGGATGPELLEKAQALFGEDHGVEFDLPSRHADRDAPRLDS